jgi:iron complex transport system substrate-binding protein
MFRRIVSLAPSNTEILYALGAGDLLVGVTNLCDYPPQVKRLPQVGGWVTGHRLQVLDQLEPDLLLASMYVPEPVKRWAEARGVVLHITSPRSLEGVYRSIREIGETLGLEERAEELIATMEKELEEVQARGAALAFRPRVYSEEFPQPPTVAANWVPELIAYAGGVPMVKPGALSHPVGLKEVAEFDPDLIVLHWCGYSDHSDPRILTRRRGWSRLKAVKQGAIYVVEDSLLNRPGPRLPKGAQALNRMLTQYVMDRST